MRSRCISHDPVRTPEGGTQGSDATRFFRFFPDMEKSFPPRNQYNCEDDPLSPPEGEATQGASPPLTPNFDLFFQMRVYGHAPRGEGRRTPSARGSITIQYCPLQIFYRAVFPALSFVIAQNNKDTCFGWGDSVCPSRPPLRTVMVLLLPCQKFPHGGS